MADGVTPAGLGIRLNGACVGEGDGAGTTTLARTVGGVHPNTGLSSVTVPCACSRSVSHRRSTGAHRGAAAGPGDFTADAPLGARQPYEGVMTAAEARGAEIGESVTYRRGDTDFTSQVGRHAAGWLRSRRSSGDAAGRGFARG